MACCRGREGLFHKESTRLLSVDAVVVVVMNGMVVDGVVDGAVDGVLIMIE